MVVNMFVSPAPSCPSRLNLIPNTVRWQLAIELFDTSPAACDVVSFNSVMTSCDKTDQWRLVGHLFAELRCASLEPDLISYTTSSSSLVAQQWQLGLQQFGQMTRVLVPDVVSYSVMISSCGSHWQLAVHLFHAMRAVQVTPNLVSYNALISSCERNSQWQWAAEVFQSIDVIIDVVTLTCTMSALGKGSHWKAAMDLWRTFPQRSLRSNLVTFNTVMSSLERCCSPLLEQRY